ncbi:MAG TPA: hypothetical protein VJU61_10020 [Polyangiaceae bacterium]|nr:hypothetical protein [Polyangiaceae bacterium]
MRRTVLLACVSWTIACSGSSTDAPADLDAGSDAALVEDASEEVADSTSDGQDEIPKVPASVLQPGALIQGDTGRNAYVGDQKRGAILVLDLEANTSLIFSGCVDAANPTCPGSRVGTGIELALPNALALDAKRGRLLVTDGANRLRAVDLETRVRTDLTHEPLYTPRSIVVHPSGDRAWVLCQGSDSIVEVDLDTGSQRSVSGCSVSTAPSGSCAGADLRGAGPALLNPLTLLYDADRDRLLVTDSDRNAIVAVDPRSGDRSILSGCTLEAPSSSCTQLAGAGKALVSVRSHAILDAERRRVIVPNGASLVTVDLQSGDRAVLSAAQQDGPSLEYIGGLALDAAHGRALLFNATDLVAVDLASGARSVITGPW